jgi:hypothetical protein
MNMKTFEQQTEHNGLSHLVSRLKSEDNSYANISKAVQIIYLLLIPFFLIMTYRNYNETGNINELISGAAFFLAFLIFIFYFGKYYNEYKYVDYSLPTVKMLRQAAYRYQLIQGRMVWILLALVLMDIGLTINRLGEYTIIKTQYYFIGAVIFGVIVGLILWYFKFKPLRDDALSLLREIES